MNSFTFRITARFALLVTATTAAVLVAGGFLLDHQTERGLELLHEIEVRELLELIGTDGSLDASAVTERIKHDADSDASLFVIQVANQHGAVLFRSDNLGATILPVETAPEVHRTATLPSIGRVHLSAFAIGPWRIYLGSPLSPSERLLRDYARMSVPLLAAAALVSIALGYAFSRATLRPLHAIEATANHIRADNLTERIPVPSGHDELASLTRLLNQMFDRLQASFQQVERFTADASHELKTPLALIRLNAEKIRARVAGDPDASAAVTDVLEEIAQMHQVIDRLLFLAKCESGALAATFREIAMPTFIAAFAEDARAIAEDRGIVFELEANEAGVVRGEPDLLRQMLLNLVSNAVSISPAGARVQLTSVATEQGWRLAVCDEGPGVPEEHLARIFGRFVRFAPGEQQRAGHGLGLAICKSIAELHRGTIRAENRRDRSGLRVVVELPK